MNMNLTVCNEPVGNVFCGPDKYLSLRKHQISGAVFPVREADSFYMLVRSGRATLTLNGMKFSVKKGDVCWINSYQVMTIETREGESVEFWSIVYDYQLFCYLMYRYSPNDLRTPAFTASPVLARCEATERISSLFERFDAIEELHFTSTGLMKVSIIGQISLLFMEENKKHVDDFNAQPLSLSWRACRYIAMHSQEHITIDKTAAALKSDPAAINRELRITTGLDFQQMLNRNRCLMASSYFLCDNLPFDYIATHSGFNSAVTFYRSFKEVMGMTPNDYRDNVLRGSPPEVRQMILDDRTFLIIKYIFDNLSEQITLKSIAENTFLTPNIIRDMLRTSFGVSYKELLSMFRVRYAESLLTSTNLPLVDLSVAAGFGSQRTFCRVFTAINGVSPADFRKQSRQNGESI